MTAITAITAQNTKGVYDIHSIPLKKSGETNYGNL